MPKSGISVPLRPNKAGSMTISTGKTHVSELLSVALNSGDSDNPFQQPGLGERFIFGLADRQTFAKIRDRIREIFEDFDDNELATLQDRNDNLTAFRDPSDPEGEYGVRVYFIDLQTDERGTLSVTAGRSGVTVSAL